MGEGPLHESGKSISVHILSLSLDIDDSICKAINNIFVEMGL